MKQELQELDWMIEQLELLLASSTGKPFAFYRLTSPSDNEGNLPEKESIGFDYGVNEDSEIGVVGFQMGVPQRNTDVPNVGQRSTSKPATSIVSLPISIDFVVNEKQQSNPKPIAKLTKWSLEDQTVRGIYSRGRFELRNDKMTSLPVLVAGVNIGIKFVDLIINDQIEWSDHQTGTIKIEFVGTYTTFISQLTSLIGA